MPDVTNIPSQIESGDPVAAEQLLPMVCDELRKLAEKELLSESSGNTLQRITTGSWDETCKVWDSQTDGEIFTLKGHEGQVRRVAFSPDGRRILTGSDNHAAKVWDAVTDRELLILKGHIETVTRVAFSDDGQMIFAWDQQKNLLAWSVASGEPVAPIDPPSEPLPGLVRSPDGVHQAIPEWQSCCCQWHETVTGKLLAIPQCHSADTLSL